MAVQLKDEKGYAADIQATMDATHQYVPSETVTAAHTHLADVSAGRPAEYSSANAEQLGSLYDKIVNRGAYSYDPSKDSTFAQYKDMYQQSLQQGAQAAQNVTGQMSGGYGNTWGGAAANQMYGEGLKAVNDVLPAMERNAYAAYQSEGDLLNTQLQATVDKDEREYQQWKDAYDAWANERQFAADREQQAWSRDYQQYRDNTNLAMQLIGYGREDQETLRANAYSMAMSLIKQGILPISELLASAGISDINALKLAKKYGYKEPSSGHHSGGGKKKSSGGKSSSGSGDRTFEIAGTAGKVKLKSSASSGSKPRNRNTFKK